MTIEEKVFARKRFRKADLLRFGFQKAKGGYRYAEDFFGGDFSAELFVSDKGEFSGRVMDKMNGEVYAPLRIESFRGAYVGSVRAAYEDVLMRIADACCTDVLFASDQANRIVEQIENRFAVRPDHPFAQSRYQDYGVFRHKDTAKWFALIMNVKRLALLKNGDENTVDIINLKTDAGRMGELTKTAGIYPAYHMSHTNWISVVLDGSLCDARVMALVKDSFLLTERKRKE